MSELSQLSPQPLWDIFAKICSIPHPSYHEEQLAEHIMGWAKEKVCTLNATGLAIFLSANLPPQVWKTVSQWYCRRTDMVPQKTTTPFTTSQKTRFSRTSTASG